jgi:hypothetical protein
MHTALCGVYWSPRLAQAVPDDAPICGGCLQVQMEDHAAPMAGAKAERSLLSRVMLRPLRSSR